MGWEGLEDARIERDFRMLIEGTKPPHKPNHAAFCYFLAALAVGCAVVVLIVGAK